MIVRRAVLSDREFIVGELKKFADFYSTNKSLFLNKENTSDLVDVFTNHHVAYVAEKDGELFGFITGYLTKHPYNPEITTLIESFWWVKEEGRKTRAGSMLLDKFISYGKEVSDFIYLTLEDESPVDERHFIKRGFKLKEKNYFMEIS